MKICILTQPLQSNYGGLLQAYALQKVLRDMGFNVITENRKYSSRKNLAKTFTNNRLIRRLLNKSFIPNSAERTILAKNTSQFVTQFIKTTNPIYDDSKRDNYDAYVVGSDQVWRPKYSPNILNYYLDFVQDSRAKKIAYAASFGVDNWEYSENLTKICSELALQFDAVSVRENSGISLCKEYLKVDAQQVLDPTLLLGKDVYLDIVKSELKSNNIKGLVTYMLDETEERKAITAKIEHKLNLASYSLMPKSRFENVGPSKIDDCILPSVAYWLQGFANAEFVITDSFHGCVFSIIFEKPFIAIANNQRGATRFTSLLSSFSLLDRLIFNADELTDDKLTSVIDWAEVANIRQNKKAESYRFLNNALK